MLPHKLSWWQYGRVALASNSPAVSRSDACTSRLFSLLGRPSVLRPPTVSSLQAMCSWWASGPLPIAAVVATAILRGHSPETAHQTQPDNSDSRQPNDRCSAARAQPLAPLLRDDGAARQQLDPRAPRGSLGAPHAHRFTPITCGCSAWSGVLN